MNFCLPVFFNGDFILFATVIQPFYPLFWNSAEVSVILFFSMFNTSFYVYYHLFTKCLHFLPYFAALLSLPCKSSHNLLLTCTFELYLFILIGFLFLSSEFLFFCKIFVLSDFIVWTSRRFFRGC